MRRLWVIKVYFDVVDDHRGAPPLCPDDVLAERDASRFVAEDIGYLTQPVDIDAWIDAVRTRYRFLAALDSDETRWTACNPGHRHDVTTAIAQLRQGSRRRGA